MADDTIAYEAARPDEEPIRMKFLMRSGNAFMIDGVLSWKMMHSHGRVISLKLTQSTDEKYARVVVDTVDLSQIEAVVILPASGPGRRANEKEGGRG